MKRLYICRFTVGALHQLATPPPPPLHPVGKLFSGAEPGTTPGSSYVHVTEKEYNNGQKSVRSGNNWIHCLLILPFNATCVVVPLSRRYVSRSRLNSRRNVVIRSLSGKTTARESRIA
jgi:hypothetical protein